MKKIVKFFTLFFGVAALTTVGCQKKSAEDGQEGYVIRGTVDLSLELDSIYIYPENTDITSMNFEKVAAGVVSDGKFEIRGKIDTVQKMIVGNMNKNVGTEIVLENAEFEMKIEPYFVEVKGGDLNEMIYGFYNSKAYRDLSDQNIQKTKALMGMSPEAMENAHELRAELDTIFYAMSAMETENYKKIIESEKAPALAKMLALTVVRGDDAYADVNKVMQMLDGYEKTLGKHRNLVAFRNFLKSEEKAETIKATVANGASYKPVSGLDDAGKPVSIDEIIAKHEYTLLEFWASWCGPCRGEIPNLKKAHEKYQGKGFEIYAFSLDEREDQWRKALKEENTPWLNVLGQGEEGKAMVDSYGVQGIPASFLIDKNGIIVASNDELRGEGLEEKLADLLK